MKQTYWLVFILAGVVACTRATPEQQIVNDAASALGGRDKILAVRTIVIEGEGTNGNLGQDMTPEATGQQFNLPGHSRPINVAAGQPKIEQTSTPKFEYMQGTT